MTGPFWSLQLHMLIATFDSEGLWNYPFPVELFTSQQVVVHPTQVCKVLEWLTLIVLGAGW